MNNKSNPWVEQINKIIFSPCSAFSQPRNIDFGNLICFIGALIISNFIFFSILGALDRKNTSILQIFTTNFLITYLILVIGIAILLIIGGLWLHILIYISGGRNPIILTFQTVLLSSTPGILFFWIPIIAVKFFPSNYLAILNNTPSVVWILSLLFFGIWGGLILIMGIKEDNGFSWMRSGFVVCCSLMIPIIICSIVTIVPGHIGFGIAFPRL
jgi:hypothetical protein